MKNCYLILLLMLAAVSGHTQASLPFYFDKGVDSLPIGMTQSGLGSDYSSSPYLKHNNTNDHLDLHFNGALGTLSFAIRYYGGAQDTMNGNFLLQFSNDGLTYTTARLYGDTTGGIVLTNADTYFDTLTSIPVGTQYIRWLYNKKETGNVGIGAIKLEELTPTPLTLLYFKGQSTVQGTLLSWKITDAVNSKGFEVQKSIDGKSFQNIGWVAFENERSNYRYVDRKDLVSKELEFYRIKILDWDGQFSFSPVVEVNRSLKQLITVGPNPVRSTLYFRGALPTGTQVIVYDRSGKIVLRKYLSNNSSLDFSKLPAGLYELDILTFKGEFHYKVIKE